MTFGNTFGNGKTQAAAVLMVGDIVNKKRDLSRAVKSKYLYRIKFISFFGNIQ